MEQTKKRNEPRNCSECKFLRSGRCAKYEQATTPLSWCAGGKKK